MRTRTRNALWLVAFACVATALLVLTWRIRRRPDLTPRALDAIPRGALLVATADFGSLRQTPLGRRLLERVRERRVIPGIGSVRDVCGFDPLDGISALALAVPAAGASGEFGIAAAGAVDAEALVGCALKVTEARGGKAVVVPVGGFRTVREAESDGAGEIAVRSGLVLLGGGTYLRAMMDAAEGRTPTIRSSPAHAELAELAGPATLTATVVLTPDLRRTLESELSAAGAEGAPASRIVAGALAVHIGETVAIHAVLRCSTPDESARLAEALRAARDERAADIAVRLIGVGDILARTSIEARGESVHARVEVPAEQAITVADRVLTLGSFRHPMPEPPSRRAAPERGDADDTSLEPSNAGR